MHTVTQDGADETPDQNERITVFDEQYIYSLVNDAYARGDEEATDLAGQVADEVYDHGGYRSGDRLSPDHERIVNDLADACAETGHAL